MSKYKTGKGQYLNGYTDEQLFENDEERNKILAMSEFQKEMIIAERIDKLNMEKEREALLNKKHEGDKSKKKEAPQTKDFLSDSNYSEDGQIKSDDEWSDERFHKMKRNRALSPSSSSSLSDSEDDRKKPKKEVVFNVSLNDIEKVKITRQFCERYWDIPIFDENIKDTFVKINIYAGKSSSSTSGNTGYILGKIKEIQTNTSKPYVFIGKQCVKYINVVHANREKLFTFNVISNSSLTENEFNQWKSHMESHKLELPSKDSLHELAAQIIKIKNFKYSNEELSMMINKKMEEKIKNKDKNINITYQLDLLTEKYNAAKAKFEETKDPKYLEIAQKAEPEIETLKKMKEEREKRESLRAEKDLVTQINKKNMERQRMEDLKFSLLNKKKQREENDIYNPYKRKHCLPQNLYDTGYIKDKQENLKNEKEKKEEEKKEKEKENKPEEKEPDEFANLNYGARKFQRFKQIESKIKSMGNLLDEMMEKDKEKNSSSNKDENGDKGIDLNTFFNLTSINLTQFYKNVDEQNKKLTSDSKTKIITLADI